MRNMGDSATMIDRLPVPVRVSNDSASIMSTLVHIPTAATRGELSRRRRFVEIPTTRVQ